MWGDHSAVCPDAALARKACATFGQELRFLYAATLAGDPSALPAIAVFRLNASLDVLTGAATVFLPRVRSIHVLSRGYRRVIFYQECATSIGNVGPNPLVRCNVGWG